MNKYLLPIALASLLASSVNAKVTLEDANRDMRAVIAANPGISQQTINDHWDRTAANPPNETGSGPAHVQTYTLNPPSDTVRTINLKPTATYICSLSRIGGYYSRGLKGFDARVFKSGSTWKMTVGKNCGGCDNWGEAVCWENK